jgi:hypothetical protein
MHACGFSGAFKALHRIGSVSEARAAEGTLRAWSGERLSQRNRIRRIHLRVANTPS